MFCLIRCSYCYLHGFVVERVVSGVVDSFVITADGENVTDVVSFVFGTDVVLESVTP